MIGIVSPAFKFPALARAIAERKGFAYIQFPFHAGSLNSVGASTVNGMVFSPHTPRPSVDEVGDVLSAYKDRLGDDIVFYFSSLPYWGACRNVWHEPRCVWVDTSLLSWLIHCINFGSVDRFYLEPYIHMAQMCVDSLGTCLSDEEMKLYQLAIYLRVYGSMVASDVKNHALRVGHAHAVSHWHVAGRSIESFVGVEGLGFDEVGENSYSMAPTDASCNLFKVCADVEGFFARR